MKRLLAIIALILLAPPVQSASLDFWKSSTTATAETTKRLCPDTENLNRKSRAVLHQICVDNPVYGMTGTITVFKSSATTDNSITTMTVNLPIIQCQEFNVESSSGLSYTTSSTATLRLLYYCF